MTSVLGKIFSNRADGDTPPPSRGDAAYRKAVAVSEDLQYLLRESERETSAARAVMSDVWSQANNVPFMTTVYEAVQEAKAGPDSVEEHFILHIGRAARA